MLADSMGVHAQKGCYVSQSELPVSTVPNIAKERQVPKGEY